MILTDTSQEQNSTNAGKTTSDRLWQRIRRFWPAFLLLIITFVFFLRIVFDGLVVMHIDMLVLYFPYRSYAAEVLKSLHFPFWNPYTLAGTPFIANIQTAVFYPPNLLYLVFPTATALSMSFVGHVFLAGVSSYLFARRALGVSQFGALIAAVMFMFSGSLLGHAGHIVVVAPMAWMPLVLLAFHHAIYHASFRNIVLAGATLTMQALAGHPQIPYYTVILLGLYVVFLSFWGKPSRGLIRKGATAGFGIMIAFALGALQFLPTLELVTQSYRSTGFFSGEVNMWAMKPDKLIESLLPHFSKPSPEEWVGYIGISGLVLSLLAIFLAFRNARVWFFLSIAVPSLILTLGSITPMYRFLLNYLPGLSSFRVPARWLIVYTFCMVMLSTLGAEALFRALSKIVKKRNATMVIALPISMFSIVTGELFLDAQALPVSCPGPSSLLTESWPAADFLAANAGSSRVFNLAPFDLTLDDEAARRQRFSKILDPKAMDDYLSFVRMSASLRANTLITKRVRVLEGYDAGLVPTGDYLRLEQDLFSGRGALTQKPTDEQLRSVLDARLLSVVGVKYVITAPRAPFMVDGIPFNLASGLFSSLNMELLNSNSVEIKPINPPIADALGIISMLSDAAQIKQGEEIAEMEVVLSSGETKVIPLRAGIETAEWSLGTALDAGNAAHTPVRVVSRKWIGRDDVNLYFTNVPLGRTSRITAIRLNYVNKYGRIHILGISSVDSNSGSKQELSLNRLEEVYRGEVSILENPNALSRAFAVHEVDVVEDEEKAYELIKDPTFDPSKTATVSRPIPIQPAPLAGKSDQVAIITDEPEKVAIQANLGSPGLLVLSDSFYPGWRVTVDGEEREIYRANGMFRGVPLEAGEHTVIFTYVPMSFYIGLVITLLSIVAVAIFLLVGPRFKGQKGGIES